MDMQKRMAVIGLTVCIAASSMIGCSVFDRTHGYNDREYSVTVETKESRLEDGSYYVMKNDGTFHRLYLGETSFGMFMSIFSENSFSEVTYLTIP